MRDRAAGIGTGGGGGGGAEIGGCKRTARTLCAIPGCSLRDGRRAANDQERREQGADVCGWHRRCEQRGGARLWRQPAERLEDERFW